MGNLSRDGCDFSGTSTERAAQSLIASTGQTFFDTTLNVLYAHNGTQYQEAATHFSLRIGFAALIGGGQPGATIILGGICRFDTVASPGDSGVLQQAVTSRVGQMQVVVNNTSNSMNVFPFLGDQINGLGANTQIAVGGNKSCLFFCTAVGQWNTLLSA